jgi:predicted MPP superfamily phosphohydrolase
LRASRKSSRARVRPSSRRRRIGFLLGALVGFALVLDACWIEPSRLVIVKEDIDLPSWPEALSGLRVALLSDLHVGCPHWGLLRLRTLVATVNREQPDLIVLAGDYLNDLAPGTIVPPPPIAAELGSLHARLGVVAVLGNHDGWHDGMGVITALSAQGIHVLDDQALRIDAHGASFCVLGLTDAETRKRTAQEELSLALPGLPLLAVVHEPDIFSQLDGRVSLTLAGHTHGGQVSLPFFGPPIVPSAFGRRYARGHVVEQGRHLFVTSGVGTSRWPIRFGVPPEIVILTLR